MGMVQDLYTTEVSMEMVQDLYTTEFSMGMVQDPHSTILMQKYIKYGNGINTLCTCS